VRYVSHLSVAATFLSMAILFGGGGSPAPLAELIVELTALATFCVWILLPAPSRIEVPHDHMLWICVAVAAAVPVLQLLPLPPMLWHILPGREVERATLDLIGKGDSWRPLSLAPYQTFASALSLIPPMVMIYFTSQLTLIQRTKILPWVAGLAILSALIGVVQVASGDADWPRFYQHSNRGLATGFQDNRNSTADILVIGILALVAYVAIDRRTVKAAWGKAVVAGLIALMMFTTILTGSRAGTTLLLMCPLMTIALFRPRLHLSRKMAAGAVGLLLVLSGTFSLLRDNAALDRTWHRFNNIADARPMIWADTSYAIGLYWPIGSGVGTFTTIFPAAERLEAVDASITNRAHEDYLEFALEAGIFGSVLLIILAAALVSRGIYVLRFGGEAQVAHAILAISVVAALALHSLVDYPIRSMSLAVITAYAIGLLSTPPKKAGSQPG